MTKMLEYCIAYYDKILYDYIHIIIIYVDLKWRVKIN
jgi:hypothetical protein